MAHAQNMWKWDSLNIKVTFNIESIEYKTGDWDVNAFGLSGGRYVCRILRG